MTHNLKVFKVFILALAILATSNTYSDACLGKVLRFTHSAEGRNKERGSWIKCYFKIQVQLFCHSQQLLFHPTTVSFKNKKNRGEQGQPHQTPIQAILIYFTTFS